MPSKLLTSRRVAHGALFVFAAAASTLTAQTSAARVAPSATCEAMRMLRLPDVRITSAVQPVDSVLARGAIKVPHCRVAGVIGKATEFVVTMPLQWNSRLYMVGNGGFAGYIASAPAQTNAGFLTVSTNTGHRSSPGGGALWAKDDPEAQLAFGYLAVHQTVEVAKVIARAFYGSEPTWSYFEGCSNGGRQALMEAQRYPEDFNGIIAGAPAIPWTGIGLAFLKNIRAAFPDTSYYTKPLLGQEQLDLLSSSVLDACDATDGVRDSIIADPRDCHFRVSSIKACPAGKSASDCLTAAQRAAIDRIYEPVRDKAGKVLYPGQPVGGENLQGGWRSWITGVDTAALHAIGVPNAQAMFLTEGAKYIMYNDPTWSHITFRGDMTLRNGPISAILDADNPDLSRFLAHNGKLILYHGWADPALDPLETIDYHDRVLARDARARESMRLYMLPGVLHCGGGMGPDNVDWLAPLMKWVEESQAPDRLVATKRARQQVVRSRPVCPYPERAVYVGQGDVNDEKSYVCRAPK